MKVGPFIYKNVNAEGKPCRKFHPKVVSSFPLFQTPPAVDADRPIVPTYKHIRHIEKKVETQKIAKKFLLLFKILCESYL